ncbi:type II toxin-antitoxin system VapC family toxin [Phycicoccus sp. CSK15P-2]|uniref:type II toxin-antitoxin system VapC family toxin n=1 Tax=Phycicoccus sp. CSK15P-2 TaxID=2807627 RepID=UPI001951F91E|nr:type II toxin-antitoxin system VapC family toxin [Phycicoccus sp. CSK15P-2]MBM6404605.1 type II toxin-antitoxin system VapC family toxin [Phycicoccus sp. CSK15P-2]
MIVDTSALVAIITDEPERDAFVESLLADPDPRMSAGSFLELCIVVDRLGSPVASRRVDDLMMGLGITVEPVAPDHVTVARAAYRDFGRGSGHPAGLNFGDCFAYALASRSGEPLLFKGEDFVHTDLRPAVTI